jgi:large subunit ribosomal protein L29
MKAAKWRDRSDEELQHEVRGLAEEVRNLRFQLAMGVAKNPSRLGEARRDLARIYTILGQRGGPSAVAAAASAAPVAPADPPPPRPARRARAARASTGSAKKRASRRPSAPRRTKAKG